MENAWDPKCAQIAGLDANCSSGKVKLSRSKDQIT
jgi:hypothetical protein